MNIVSVWKFIVGDSRYAPVSVGIATVVTAVLVHISMIPSVVGEISLFSLIVVGLVASVFEKIS